MTLAHIYTVAFEGMDAREVDLTWISCAKRFVRTCLGKEPRNGAEEVWGGADCDAASPD
jgi:hypothetical protein